MNHMTKEYSFVICLLSSEQELDFFFIDWTVNICDLQLPTLRNVLIFWRFLIKHQQKKIIKLVSIDCIWFIPSWVVASDFFF